VARVAEMIGRHDIHIESLGQEPHLSKDELSLGITVDPVSEPVICCAVDAANSFVFVLRPVVLAPH
jgi:hypothetical protein